MDVAFVSSEVGPFSRTGGLGDVCGALPRALARLGHRAITISPAYRGAARPGYAWEPRGAFWYWLFGARHEVRFWVAEESDHLAHVLVSNPCFDREGLYGDRSGAFGDNQLRFALLSRAALDVPRLVPLWGAHPLGELDVFHGHDWQAALAPLYLEALYKPLGLYPKTRAVMTVHNAAHQATFAPASLGGLDLSSRHWGALEHAGLLNTLKGGLAAAQHTTAVSPTFAQELQSLEGGFGLHEVFRHRAHEGRLTGILNGIDTELWDPAHDKALPAPFHAPDLTGKAACKRALQAELGLPQEPRAALLGVVSRLDWQKGIDLLLKAADRILQAPAQLVVLGNGDPNLEAGLRVLAQRHPSQARAVVGFDDALSRRIFAASDLVLVPSRFEPCGLTQLYAMRYGAVPIVRDTGGLHDTVHPWEPASGLGTGWRFSEPHEDALAEAVGWALHTYQHYPDAFDTLRRNGLSMDWSWDAAARRYEEVYDSLTL